MSQKNKQKFGQMAEARAREFLSDKGYSILESNWRFHRYEIDIIGAKDDLIVFFEVKARSTDEYGEPEVFVNKRKQKFLITAADHYLRENEIENEARFDVVSLLWINNNFSIKHLEGAFYPSLK